MQARCKRAGARRAQAAERAAGAGKVQAWARGALGGGGGGATWACLYAQGGRDCWSVGPSWCTVHLAQF